MYYLTDKDGNYVKGEYGNGQKLNTPKIAIHAAIALLMLILVMMAGCPPYAVWEQRLTGEAELRRAEENRKILVEQARAERDSAALRAEAIGIVGQAAKDFPEYRYQEFLGAFGEALQSDAVDKIIFVPTEANIPVTEAGRTVKQD